MTEQNGSQGPSNEPLAPDFNHELNQARTTGDFDFVLHTAKQSDRMLREFRDAVMRASFPGRDTGPVAMGVNFLDKMIEQSAGQLNALKRAEKESKAALKVVGPEEPQVPPETPQAPEAPSA